MEFLVDDVAKKRTNKNKRWKHVNIVSQRKGIGENVDASGSGGRPRRVVGEGGTVSVPLTVAVQGH